jgi:diguanylate cyclase (GGDEF)-like protein
MKTILLVDDETINLNALSGMLNKTYNIVTASSGFEAIDIISKKNIDLILLDIVMPKMDGFAVCKALKVDFKTKKIPIIFLTTKTDEESIEKAYEIGCVDYVIKPFRLKELLSRIKRELSMQKMVHKLELLSITDSLTGLYNRRYFTEVSKHILDLAKRENKPLSVVMIDIDNFKNINDTYGHQVGDKALVSLSKRLMKCQRKSDIICRYGGEEFVILFPNTSLDGAVSVAEKIRQKIANIKIKSSSEKISFTISLGVSHVDLKDTNIERSLKNADDALYEAKNNGKNKVSIFRGGGVDDHAKQLFYFKKKFKKVYSST